MEESIIEYKNYGKVNIVINKIMDKKGITIYRMSKITGLKHQTIKGYYNNEPLTRVDLDVLARMCFVLDCKISDVLEYNKNENSNKI